MLVLGQVLDTRVRVSDPEQKQLADIDVSVIDLGIEQTRTRDWLVTRVAVRSLRRLGRRSTVTVVDWHNVQGLTPSGLAMPGQGVAQLLHQFEGRRPVEVADALRDLPAKRRVEVINALDDERLADVLQELPDDDQTELLIPPYTMGNILYPVAPALYHIPFGNSSSLSMAIGNPSKTGLSVQDIIVDPTRKVESIELKCTTSETIFGIMGITLLQAE